VAGLFGLVRKNHGKMYGERLVLDNDGLTTPVRGALGLRPHAAPSGTPAEGEIYFDDTAEALKWYDGSAWQTGASLEHASQTFTGAVTVTGALTGSSTIAGNLLVTSVTGATAAPTTSGVYVLNRAGGIDVTLPALASASGLHMLFIAGTTVTDDYIITAATGDLLTGAIINQDTDSSDAVVGFSPDGTDDLIITMNGDSTGGLAGSWIELIGTSATSWFVRGHVRASGNAATPFS
jgi:hypothetical protein